MNRDEAEKCLVVARRLLEQVDTADADAAHIPPLDRALKYAEKGKRLDADAAGASADALIAQIVAKRRTVGASASGPGGRWGAGAGSGGAPGTGGAPGSSAGARNRARPRVPPPRIPHHDEGGDREGHPGAGGAHGQGPSHLRLPRDARRLARRDRRRDKRAATQARAQAPSGQVQSHGRRRRVQVRQQSVRLPQRRGQARRVRSIRHRDPTSLGGRGGQQIRIAARGPPAPRTIARKTSTRPRYSTCSSGVDSRVDRACVTGRTAARTARARSSRGNRRPSRVELRRPRAPGGAEAIDRRYHSVGDDPTDVLRNLFQLLPLLLMFLMYLIAPGGETHYALNRSPTFRHELRTDRLNQPFYVKSEESFEEAFPTATRPARAGRAQHRAEPHEQPGEQLSVRAAAAAAALEVREQEGARAGQDDGAALVRQASKAAEEAERDHNLTVGGGGWGDAREEKRASRATRAHARDAKPRRRRDGGRRDRTCTPRARVGVT